MQPSRQLVVERGRPTNRLDMQTEQTASVSGTWLATRHLLFGEMKLCRLVNRPFKTYTAILRRAATPATLPLTSAVKQSRVSHFFVTSC